MTDRHAGYIVTIDENIREDVAQEIVTALGMVKNVVSVTPIVADHALAIAQERVRFEMRGKFYEFYVSLFQKDT